MSKITETLNNLKSKLKNLEDEVFISSIKNSVPVKEKSYNKKLKEKLAYIEGIQETNNKVILDVRGDTYEIDLSTINNCILENIVKDEIKQKFGLSSSKTSIFLNFDRKNFPLLLSIIFYFNKNNLSIEDFNNTKYKIYLNKTKDATFVADTKKLLEIEIKSFFTDINVLNRVEFIE